MQNVSSSIVVFLGAGVMQFPAVYIAKRLGYHTYAFDKNPQAYCAPHLDRFISIDIRDTNRIIGVLRNDADSIHGIYSIGTDFQYQVSLICKALSLPSLTVMQSKYATYKSLMKKKFIKAGILTAPHTVYKNIPEPKTLHTRYYVKRLPKHLRFPLIVKPVDNMGARGVQIVKDLSTLQGALYRAQADSASTSVICENFIEGEELSIDILLSKGAIQYQSIAQRIIGFAPYRVELGHSIPACLSPHIQSKALKVLLNAAVALGIKKGAIKGDLIVVGKDVYIAELAARPSGGYMSGWTSMYGEGNSPLVSFLSSGTRQVLDDTVPSFERAYKNSHKASNTPISGTSCCAERAIMSVPGVVTSVGYAKNETIPSWCKHIFFGVTPGEAIQFPVNNVGKVGNIIISAPQHSSLPSRILLILSKLDVRVIPNPTADAFLASSWKQEVCATWYNHSAPQLIAFEQDYANQKQYSENISVENLAGHMTALPINISLFESLWSRYATRSQYPDPTRPLRRMSVSSYHKDAAIYQLGTWTHATLQETVHMAIKRRLLYTSKKNVRGQGLILRAVLRAGFSGLRYLMQHGIRYKI